MIFADTSHLYVFGGMNGSWAAGYYDVYDDYKVHDIALEYGAGTVSYRSFIAYSGDVYACIQDTDGSIKIIEISSYDGSTVELAKLAKMPQLFYITKSRFFLNEHQYNSLFYVFDTDNDGLWEIQGVDLITYDTWLEYDDMKF